MASEMDFGSPALGLLFAYSKAKSGLDSWKLFWRVIKGQEFFAKLLLFEGDLAEDDMVFCIGIQAIDQKVLSRIRKLFDENADFGNVAASPKFIEANDVKKEPLPQAGKIDELGRFTPKGYNSKAAYDATNK